MDVLVPETILRMYMTANNVDYDMVCSVVKLESTTIYNNCFKIRLIN